MADVNANLLSMAFVALAVHAGLDFEDFELWRQENKQTPIPYSPEGVYDLLVSMIEWKEART